MVQCEMCGKETKSPNKAKIEGAVLEVCDECTDFGTEIKEQTSSSTSTKYSTGSSSSGSSSSSSSGAATTGSSSGGSTGGGRRRDMFDDMDEIAEDFDEQIRTARESAGLSQEELADNLNEKASLIRKLERGDTLPTDSIQQKLERKLDIDLTAGGGVDESEWSSGSSTGSYTLGDVVERKDS